MGKTESRARERILARIQSALTVPVSPRHANSTAQIFPTISDPLERFREECAANGTECQMAEDTAAATLALADIVASLPPGEVFLQDAPLLRRMAFAWPANRDVRWSGEGPPNETSQATITLAESLVAATGSVVVSSACGGRGGSIVAPVHIVVATIAQLAPTLATALEWIAARDTAKRNSMVSLITGPSRTGDIEKIIVLGAHGPQRLVVILAVHGEEES